MKCCNHARCNGCGVILSNNRNDVGSIKKNDINNFKYCQRCFKINHYSKLDNPSVPLTEIDNNFNKIKYDEETIIFHVLDILNLDDSIIPSFLTYQDRLYFIVNKVDCLPKSYNATVTRNLIEKTLSDFGFQNLKIIYTSVQFKETIKRLNASINNLKKNCKKIIFVGKSNVGKSSLINALLSLNNQKGLLTVSPFINTTIDLVNIKLNKISIIDTPGQLCTNNICNFLASEDAKKIVNNKNLKAINFYINVNNALVVDKLCAISYISGTKKASITCYFSNYLKICKIKVENIDRNLKSINNKISYLKDNEEFEEYTFNLTETKKHNISISGLGLISCSKGMKMIKINIKKGIGVKKNLYAII